MKNKVRVLALIMALATILSSLVIVVPASAAGKLPDQAEPLKELVIESDGRPWTDFAGRVMGENGYYLFADGTEDIPADESQTAIDEELTYAAGNADPVDTASATEEKEYMEAGFAGGSGTEADPYQIATAEQLALLSVFMRYTGTESTFSRFQYKYYVLTADIDLAGHEWVPIANSSSASNPDARFRGKFDGQGHTIKNMTITPMYRYDWTLDPENPANASQLGVTNKNQQTGLFGYLGGSAEVGNFTLTGSINIQNHTNASSKVGLVVGEVSGSAVVHDIDAYGTITVVAKVGELPVGGLVGRSNNTVIRDCNLSGSIEVYGGTADKGVIPCVGGITSHASGALTIDRTVNNASITIYGNGTNSIVGGIVGKCGQISGNSDPVVFGTNLTDCVNNGTVTVATIPGGTSPNNQRAGGIVGNIGRGSSGDYYMINVSLIRCINTANVLLASNVTFGGSSGVCSLVGWMEKQSIYWRNEKNQMLDANGNVTTDKNQVKTVSTSCKITIEDCMVINTADSLIRPHFNGGGVDLNGKTFSGYGNLEGADLFFAATAEVGSKNATIRLTKAATRAMIAAGYTLNITYGTYRLSVKSIEQLEKVLTDDYNSYKVTTKAIPGAEVKVTLSDNYFDWEYVADDYATVRFAKDSAEESYYIKNQIDNGYALTIANGNYTYAVTKAENGYTLTTTVERENKDPLVTTADFAAIAEIFAVVDGMYTFKLDVYEDVTPVIKLIKEQAAEIAIDYESEIKDRLCYKKVTHTVTAREATWSDLYAEKYYPLDESEKVAKAGTEANPYVIFTPGQLGKLSADVASFDKSINGAHFILAADIDLSAHEWLPIGMASANAQNGSYSASAVINGYNHSIKNVRLTQDSYYTSQSFVGEAAFDISNVIFDGVTLVAPAAYPESGAVGAVVGVMSGGTLENVHLKNFALNYRITEENVDLAIGGLVGILNGGKIINSSVDGTIYVVSEAANNLSVGAFAGAATVAEIRNSTNNAQILVAVDNQEADVEVGVGGFIGTTNCSSSTEKVTVAACYNTGDVTVNYSNAGDILRAAGIIGSTATKSGTIAVEDNMNVGAIAINLVEGEAATKTIAASILGYYGASSLTLRRNVSMTGVDIIGEHKTSTFKPNKDNVVADFGIEFDDRAGLRLDVTSAEESGLMFRASYDEEMLATLSEKGYEITYGMVIAPTAAFVAANGLVEELEGPRTVIDCASVMKGGRFAGVVTDLGSEYLTTDISAVASITIVKRDDVGNVLFSKTIYNEYEAGAVENNVLALAEYVIFENRSEAKVNEYQYLTAEGDFSPYTLETLARLKEIYFPANN